MAKADIKREFLDPHVLARLKRLQIYARGLVEGTFAGIHKSPHRGSSVEFSQYRKYEPGDDPKKVDWTVYARTDRFYVKEFEAETNLRCYLMIDASGSMGYGAEHGSKIDYARRMAATLAQLLIQQGDAVGLQCFSERVLSDVPPRSHAKHLHFMFDVLQDLKPHGTTDLVKVLHDLAEKIRRRAMVIVFSDLFTEVAPLLDCFQHLRHRKHDVAVFHLLDQTELDFEFSRPIRFLDMESSFSLVSEPAMIRNEYLRAVDEYMGEMRQGCTEFGVDYRTVSLAESYEDVLATWILERMR
jgi:uncharacterized protein (DUF58 family)